uniref:Uncharacterized protein n=1 Tax=Romanomermis culicivorax TaxID=13658 RepID=A0A915L3T5_ROMCU
MDKFPKIIAPNLSTCDSGIIAKEKHSVTPLIANKTTYKIKPLIVSVKYRAIDWQLRSPSSY